MSRGETFFIGACFAGMAAIFAPKEWGWTVLLALIALYFLTAVVPKK